MISKPYVSNDFIVLRSDDLDSILDARLLVDHAFDKAQAALAQSLVNLILFVKPFSGRNDILGVERGQLDVEFFAQLHQLLLNFILLRIIQRFVDDNIEAA